MRKSGLKAAQVDRQQLSPRTAYQQPPTREDAGYEELILPGTLGAPPLPTEATAPMDTRPSVRWARWRKT